MSDTKKTKIPPTPGEFPGLGSILNVISRLSDGITYNGKEYVLKELTFEQAARYSAFLKNRAKREAFRDDEENVSLQMRTALLQVVMNSIACGDYEPGSVLYLQSMTNPYCAKELMYILFHDEDESFTYEDADNLIKERLKQVAAEMQRQGELLKKS